MSGPELSVVVPVFNEAAGIAASVGRLSDYLDRRQVAWELVVVDDGSADETVAVVRELTARDQRIRMVLGGRRGKGAAVRRGMMEATGSWRFMADADLSMPADNIGRFFSTLQDSSPAPHILIGSREAVGALRIGEPWVRHVAGRLFNLVVRAVGVPGLQDTQCGFKMFSAEAARALFPHTTIDGFAFDVELLFLARRAGFRVREVGIEWHCRVAGRVSAWRGAAAFADILRVRWNGWRGRYQDVPSPAMHDQPRVVAAVSRSSQ